MLSVGHMMVIFLVALVVLGPEKLPQVARTLGKVMADFRKITGDFRSQIEDGMRDIERQTRLKEEAAAIAGAMPQPPPLAGVEPASAPNSKPNAQDPHAGPGTPYDVDAAEAEKAATTLSHENPAGENPIHEGLGGPVELPPVTVGPPDPNNPDDERYHST